MRQRVDASGTIVGTQSFDPYGNLLSSSGTLTSYGFAGEWTDGTSLQYLRARYYSPATGSFLSRDPFSGSLNQPATLNAYSYAGGNPILYSDPSGRCFDGISTVVCAIAFGAGIGAAVDIGTQVARMHPQNLGQAFNCLDWGEVGAAAGAGAVAGLAGFVSFGAITTIFGTSLLPTLGGGALSGALAGQYGRLAQLAFSGQLSQAGAVMFRPEDMALDAALGGLFAGVGYGFGKLTGSGEGIVASSECSFSGDTPVTTQDGETPIDQIQVGEEVLAFDQESNTVGYYPVTAKFAHIDEQLVILVIDGEAIETTFEHPFYTTETGWTPAGKLWIGAHVLRADSSSGEVEHIDYKRSKQTMFNLTVNQAHTYFVGEGHWLVHNACPIFGNVQKGTTEAHNAKMQEVAELLANSGKYEEVWMDTSVRIATRGQVLGRTKPDVLGLNFTNQTAHVVEIPSPSQLRGKGGGYIWEFLRQIDRSQDAFIESGWSFSYSIIHP